MLYLKKLRVDDLLEKKKIINIIFLVHCMTLDIIVHWMFHQCMSFILWPYPLLGTGFDKCFFPVDCILVTDTKIPYSNFNLVK